MLNLNMDVGEAAIVECEGGDEALQLPDAVTGRAAPDPLKKEIPCRA
jgi:hypothetical protein